MVHIYIDAEFDAVKINGKYCQMVVSLGGGSEKGCAGGNLLFSGLS